MHRQVLYHCVVFLIPLICYSELIPHDTSPGHINCGTAILIVVYFSLRVSVSSFRTTNTSILFVNCHPFPPVTNPGNECIEFSIWPRFRAHLRRYRNYAIPPALRARTPLPHAETEMSGICPKQGRYAEQCSPRVFRRGSSTAPH
jgi:hypothetical protein